MDREIKLYGTWLNFVNNRVRRSRLGDLMTLQCRKSNLLYSSTIDLYLWVSRWILRVDYKLVLLVIVTIIFLVLVLLYLQYLNHPFRVAPVIKCFLWITPAREVIFQQSRKGMVLTSLQSLIHTNQTVVMEFPCSCAIR